MNKKICVFEQTVLVDWEIIKNSTTENTSKDGILFTGKASGEAHLVQDFDYPVKFNPGTLDRPTIKWSRQFDIDLCDSIDDKFVENQINKQYTFEELKRFFPRSTKSFELENSYQQFGASVEPNGMLTADESVLDGVLFGAFFDVDSTPNILVRNFLFRKIIDNWAILSLDSQSLGGFVPIPKPKPDILTQGDVFLPDNEVEGDDTTGGCLFTDAYGHCMEFYDRCTQMAYGTIKGSACVASIRPMDLSQPKQYRITMRWDGKVTIKQTCGNLTVPGTAIIPREGKFSGLCGLGGGMEFSFELLIVAAANCGLCDIDFSSDYLRCPNTSWQKQVNGSHRFSLNQGAGTDEVIAIVAATGNPMAVFNPFDQHGEDLPPNIRKALDAASTAIKADILGDLGLCK